VTPPAAPGGENVGIVGASKLFGSKAALRGVDLQVEPGSFVVMLGPSGSGKTTLLRCLAGIERLSGGTISIGDRLVAGPGVHLPPERRHLAMVFQDYALWPHMTALRNVAFPLRQVNKVPAAEARARAHEMLERVGLGRLAERYPNELSGGEQQRVALARALVGGVGLLLFDEPLSNLDADMREQLRLAISTLARDSGATSVYITHDQSEAFSLADRVGVLRDGCLVQLGAPEELYLQPASPFVARFTGICAEAPVVLAGEPFRTAHGQLVPVRLPPQSGAAVVTASLPRPVSTGDRLQMFVRHSAVRINEGADAQLKAHVRDVAFAGRGYEHALAAPGPLLFTKAFSERRWERGTTVGVSLNPEGCLVLAAGHGPAGSSSEGNADGNGAGVGLLDLTEAVAGQRPRNAPAGPSKAN
jgi:ABC-type Fe3+/spermidine/putrescine transport system ATPase subunit